MDTRRPASQRVSKWGLVHGWLVVDRRRRVTLEASDEGFVVVASDPTQGNSVERVGVYEDPSTAAWRAITKLTP